MFDNPFTLFPLLRSMFVTFQINARHTLHGPVSKYRHPMENLMFNALSTPGIHVHWGAYMSGKSTAAKDAGLRLQASENRLVILLHGYNLFCDKNNDVRTLLRNSIGVPGDEKNLTKYFDRPSSIIIDHFEYVNQHDKLLHALREMGVGALLIVSSWERAIELRDAGCKLLGRPGCGRWTEEQLLELRDALGKEPDEETMRVSVVSGTPMYVGSFHENMGLSSRRAVLQDAEWRNGIFALENGAVEGVVGMFPDRNMRFHWKVAEKKVC
jgi:hypothetical protein